MPIDEETLDSAGHRSSNATPRNELIVRAFASPNESDFVLYEDDGRSLAYDSNGRPSYHYRTTIVSQEQTASNSVTVKIADSVNVGGPGAFNGAILDRSNVVQLVVQNAGGASVRLNGSLVTEFPNQAAFEGAASGWYNAGPNLIIAKSDAMNVNLAKTFQFQLNSAPLTTSVNFVCDRGFTKPGESVYVVGSIPELGNWDPARAVKLSPNIYYQYIWGPPANHNGPGRLAPVWTRVVSGLSPNKTFEWKCIRKRDNGTGNIEYEPGPNNVFTNSQSGYSGSAFGSF
jgi:alpha-glucosidase